jgi:RimJ/RimL family protein N-acetyltransferase
MSSQPTLRTERVILRPFHLSDSDIVEKLAGDKKIASTTLNILYPYSVGGAKEWLENHKPNFSEGKGVVFAITLKNSGEVIGAIRLADSIEHNQAELG